jgi:hypothetical protein
MAPVPGLPGFLTDNADTQLPPAVRLSTLRAPGACQRKRIIRGGMRAPAVAAVG